MRRGREERREADFGVRDLEVRDQAAVDRAVERVRSALRANGIRAEVYGPRVTKRVH